MYSICKKQDSPPSPFPRRGFCSSELFFFLCVSTNRAIHAMGRHITMATNISAVLAPARWEEYFRKRSKVTDVASV